MTDQDAAKLARRLGHAFADPALLERALTHRSAGSVHYERLEFLGDAVLSLVIAAELHRRQPDAPEGDLSRLRASLVREKTLAAIAGEQGFGDYLRMGPGETRNGGFRRASILADVVESLIGAVFLDAGFDAARGLILRLFDARLEALPAADSLKDPKTRLQEYLQARGRSLPEYAIVDASGAEHARTFTAVCALGDDDLTTRGSGAGRRRAEQAAARAMLEKLTHAV